MLKKLKKSSPNLPKIDAEIEARERSKKVNIRIFSGSIFSTNTAQKSHQKLNQKSMPEKYRKHNAKRSKNKPKWLPKSMKNRCNNPYLKKL